MTVAELRIIRLRELLKGQKIGLLIEVSRLSIECATKRVATIPLKRKNEKRRKQK